jgi:hypothetical protein
MVTIVQPPAAGSDSTGRSEAAPDSSWVRRNALALTCLTVFTVLLWAQSMTGWHASNADLEEHGQATVSYLTYIGGGGFAEATFENWESEFLQMAAFVLLTVFLIQKGSPESKQPGDERDDDPEKHRDDPGAPWPVRRGGLWLKLYENSLFLAFAVLFVGSIVGHAVGGAADFNEEQQLHGEPSISVVHFATTSQFWFESFQNWQSEFLAVFALVVLGIFLRQRGSSQSKPVYAPHGETGD